MEAEAVELSRLDPHQRLAGGRLEHAGEVLDGEGLQVTGKLAKKPAELLTLNAELPLSHQPVTAISKM